MKHSLLFTLSLLAALAVGYFAGFKHGRSSTPSGQPPSVSFYSLRRLERGEIRPTEEFLASRVAYFYLSYGPADHPRKQLDDTGLGLLQAIHDFSQTNDVLQAALKKRGEDFSK